MRVFCVHVTRDQDFPYEDSTEREKMVYEGQFILTEAEPVLDGADTLRFGRDIFVTLTHVCYCLGVHRIQIRIRPDIR